MVVNIFQTTHHTQHAAYSWGRDIGCSFWVENVICCLHISSLYCMQMYVVPCFEISLSFGYLVNISIFVCGIIRYLSLAFKTRRSCICWFIHLNAGTIYEQHLSYVITVSADVQAANGARSSGNAALIKFQMCYFTFHWTSMISSNICEFLFTLKWPTRRFEIHGTPSDDIPWKPIVSHSCVVCPWTNACSQESINAKWNTPYEPRIKPKWIGQGFVSEGGQNT